MCLPLMALRGHEIKYASGKSALCIPFDDAGRHVGLTARVNDRDGLRLVLDTGASGSTLDKAVADALHLEVVGTQESRGSGGSEMGTVVRGVNVSLPGLQLIDQTMGTLTLGPIAAQAGRPLDGILGHPVFERAVVEIDYPKRCVSFFDPDGYKYTGSGVSVPLTFKQDIPYVKASVVLPDGRSVSGKFQIDTGASSNVLLTPEAVEKEDIDSAVGKTIKVQSRGVGGTSEIRLARLARLELGGFSLEQPVAAFHPEGKGRISAEKTVGNIGGGILSRFKVVFDYPGRRMILEPGPDIAKPFEIDMSGLSLVSLAPDYRRVTVARVMDGSPAFAAGVQPGDELESVDGKPIAEIGLPALRERLRTEGQELRLALRRGGESITLDLKTRRML